MSYIYITLWSGKKLNLDKLNSEEKEWLRECFELFQQKCDWLKFFNKTHGSESIRIMGGELWNGKYWIDAELYERSVVYKVLEDLADILGMEQGFIAKQEIDFTQNEAVIKSFLES